jgi:hypothetical protein
MPQTFLKENEPLAENLDNKTRCATQLLTPQNKREHETAEN